MINLIPNVFSRAPIHYLSRQIKETSQNTKDKVRGNKMNKNHDDAALKTAQAIRT